MSQQLNNSDLVRLNKYLALNLGISRRQADDLISDGKVKINQEIAKLGARISPKDRIILNGKTVDSDVKLTYLILNKPTSYVCSRRSQGETPTIYELLPQRYHHLKSVGRLDKDSSGLIILTNDGEFTYKMTHPKFYKTKVYQVSLDKPLEPLHQQMISDFGVTLEDGPSKITLEKQSDNHKDWIATMHEGRNRQIRRTFASLGYTVTKLHRTNFGQYGLDDIKSSEFRTTNLI